MEMSSCATNLLMLLSGVASFVLLLSFPPNFNKMFAKLGKLDFKGALLDTPFIPVTVPIMAILALTITISVNKEVKVNDATLITYKECGTKETKVATVKLPGCIVASL